MTNICTSRLKFVLFVLGMVATFALVEAKAVSSCCQKRWQNPLKGSFELGAAALYEQACVQNYIFVRTDINNGAVDLRSSVDIKPRLNWGFKLWGSWYNCDRCYFATLSWKHLWSNKDSGRASRNGNVFVINGSNFNLAQSARASQRTMYDTFFLRAGSQLYGTACAHFYAYGALRGVFSGVRRIIKDNVASKIYDRTDFHGGGVEIGVRGTYQIGCGFGLLAELAGMALVGNRSDHYYFFELAAEAYRFPRRNATVCVPGMDCRFAINYGCDCRCRYCKLRLMVELGWEMDYYWNMLYQRAVGIAGVAANGLIQGPINFGTNGPYGSLSVRF